MKQEHYSCQGGNGSKFTFPDHDNKNGYLHEGSSFVLIKEPVFNTIYFTDVMNHISLYKTNKNDKKPLFEGNLWYISHFNPWGNVKNDAQESSLELSVKSAETLLFKVENYTNALSSFYNVGAFILDIEKSGFPEEFELRDFFDNKGYELVQWQLHYDVFFKILKPTPLKQEIDKAERELQERIAKNLNTDEFLFSYDFSESERNRGLPARKQSNSK